MQKIPGITCLIITALLLYHASQPHPYFSRDPSPRHLKINIQRYKHKYKPGAQQKAIGVHFLDLSLVKAKPNCKETLYKKKNPEVLWLYGLSTGTFTIYPNATPGKPKFCRQMLKETPQQSGTSGDCWHQGLSSSMSKKRRFPTKRHRSHPSTSTAEAKGENVVRQRRYLIHNLFYKFTNSFYWLKF